MQAYKQACDGQRVLFVESGTFIGTELTKYQRPWVNWEEAKRECLEFWFPIEPNINYNEGQIVPLHMGQLKRKLEDRLLEAGVELLYGVKVVARQQLHGVWELSLGSKGGLTKVRSREVYAARDRSPRSQGFVWTIDFTEVSLPNPAYQIPTELGVIDNQVVVYPGAMSPDHVFVEVCLEDSSPRAISKLLLVAKHLVDHEATFQGARIGVCSLEPAPGMVQSVSLPAGSPELTWQGIPVPILETVDVLVVGGGTSGATAARASAERGARTTLVEANTRLGGTGTVGGVNKYWFGNRNGFTVQIDKRVRELSEDLGLPSKRLFWSDDDCWHLEVKASTLLQMCAEAGVSVLFNSTAIGVVMGDETIEAVVFANEDNVFAIAATVVIDATGDADLAVLGGAPVVYGNERDFFTLWYSLAQYHEPGESVNNFGSTVHVGEPVDFTRAILVGRRRGENLYDHGSYLAPRESRHIVGEITITLKDQLMLRQFPDAVNVCFSNHDPKGISVSESVLCGLLPPHLEIEVPYRALLPQGIRNLLVVGKAISATHDAFAALRMQPDLQNLGGVAGVAGALAVKVGAELRAISVAELQKQLIKAEVLPATILSRPTNAIFRPDYAALVDSLTAEEPWEWMEMGMSERATSVSPITALIFAPSQEVVPLLTKSHQQAEGRLKLQYARLLVWHGEVVGLPDVISEIERLIEDDPPLPRRQGSTRFATRPPDHGVMPEACYLLYTLARVRSPLYLPIFERVTEGIFRVDRDYNDIRLGLFHYIDSIAYVADKQRNQELVPLLLQLSTLPEFQSCVVTEGLQVDVLGERLAYLSLRIQRALAQCGHQQGFDGLEEYLSDNRALLRESARRELDLLKHAKLS